MNPMSDSQHAELLALRAGRRETTLHEMLRACHDGFHQCLVVETDKTKTTIGGLTKPEGRKRPDVMLPWLDFDPLQLRAFQSIEEKLHPAGEEPKRAFKSMAYIESSSLDVQEFTIASEMDLREYQKPYVDRYVIDILKAVERALRFHNTSHAIELGTADSTKAENGPQTPNRSRKLSKINNADRFVVSSDGGLVTTGELKPPHKLPENTLDSALGPKEPIVLEDILKEPTSWEDPDETIQQARRLVAVAATQTYAYMLEGGCRYGYIATGQAMVFLKIDDDDSHILYYHLALPSVEVASESDQAFNYSKTSIAQLASFCSMAMDSPRPDQAWVDQAIQDAKVWEVDYDIEWRKTPMAQRKELKEKKRKDRAYSKSGVVERDRSPVITRSTKRCKTDTPYRPDDEDSGDEGRHKAGQRMPQPELLASKTGSQSQQKIQSGRSTTSSGKQQQQRQYCTQSCLLGLVNRQPIDEACPNARLHPKRKQTNVHSLTKRMLCQKLRQQLERTRDEDCDYAGISGSRGMLFKLSLASHGYTFVAKATIEHWIPELLHEGHAYEQLHDLQGKLIPVYLGNIDLVKPYRCWFSVLTHMLLLAYGGVRMTGEKDLDGLEDQVLDFEDAIAARGVRHLDLEPRNMLWSKELGRLIFIDFERSIVDTELALPRPKPGKKVLQPKASDHGRKRKALQELDPPPGASNKKIRTLEPTMDPTASPLKYGLGGKGINDGQGGSIETQEDQGASMY
ncbi:MAG: hypothetical protein Q9218_003472 [Villophora microphyllina]